MSLRRYLQVFSSETQTISRGVSKELEATRILKEAPQTVFHFEDLDGYEAVGNLWATRDRISRALNVSKERLPRAILQAYHHPLDFKIVERAPFMANDSTDFDLRESPVPKWYPGDAGRYITSAVIIAEWEGKRNMSFHRILLLDSRRAVARVVPRHLHSMYRRALEAGEELKVSVAIGLEPWTLIAAGMSVEYEADEMRIASSLKKDNIGGEYEAVRLRNGIVVPAEAEYVFEARMLSETHEEGPFVDALQTYDTARQEPVLEFERAYHVEKPLFHALLPGGSEHLNFMGMPREPLIYEGVSKVVPYVNAVRLTEGGCAWLHGIVSIRKEHEGDGKNAILAAFSSHASMKQVIVVDEDIDIFNDREVEWAVATRYQAHKGLVVVSGAKGSSIDPSAGETSSKMGIDATKPVGAKGFDKAVV